MSNTFDIPMPIHLIKWVSVAFFENQPMPFKVNENTLLGKLVVAVLQDPRNKDLVDEDYEYSITLELSSAICQMSPSLLKLKHLRLALDQQFKNDLQTYVTAQVAMGQSRFKASQSFMNSFELTEADISIDTVYQIVKRVESRKYNYARKKTETPFIESFNSAKQKDQIKRNSNKAF